jgi:hypothetical protein
VASKCCEEPPKPLLVAPKEDKKCKVNAAALKSTFNTYVMNKQQNTNLNNTIDFSDEEVTKKMGKAAVSLMFNNNANIDFSFFCSLF